MSDVKKSDVFQDRIGYPSFWTDAQVRYASKSIREHDALVAKVVEQAAEIERLESMSISTLDIDDVRTLLTVGFRHAEIKGDFETQDILDAFDEMIRQRKKCAK